MKNEQEFLESVYAKRDQIVRRRKKIRQIVAMLCVVTVIGIGAAAGGVRRFGSGNESAPMKDLLGLKGEGTVGTSKEEEAPDAMEETEIMKPTTGSSSLEDGTEEETVLGVLVSGKTVSVDPIVEWMDGSGGQDEIPVVYAGRGAELKLILPGNAASVTVYAADEKVGLFREEKAIGSEVLEITVQENGWIGVETGTPKGDVRYVFQVKIA